MADSSKLVTLAVLGVAGYFVYEWLFAPVAAAAAPAAGGSAAGGAGTAAAPNTAGTTGSGAGTNAQPAGPGCNPVGALAQILTLAQKGNPALKLGPSGTDTLNIDQWDYYGNQWCTGYLDQMGVNADTLFPGDTNRGGDLNWNAFAGYAQQKGLSGPIGSHVVRRRRAA